MSDTKKTPKANCPAPIDLLGRGHKWPGANQVDTAVIERILHCEVAKCPRS